jgi:hypothetical protein
MFLVLVLLINQYKKFLDALLGSASGFEVSPRTFNCMKASLGEKNT